MLHYFAQVNAGLHGDIAVALILVIQRNAKIHVNEQVVQVNKSLGGPRCVRVVILLPNCSCNICVPLIATKLDFFLNDFGIL